MSSSFQATSPRVATANAVARLRDATVRLEREAASLDLPPLAGRDWYEILVGKLIPQLTDDAFLVVAVVGGTNIGKSVIFNHIAGVNASATSPLASGTKHPTCLVPDGFPQSHDLGAIFPEFELERWTHSGAALEESPRHVLFWRESDATPENLLVLDTPDIDSDARVNWERADHIRHTADVLIAVLTQQKYNDAAVKTFFRHAADEGKLVIVVFNQVLLPEDEEYWPRWVETFCAETGIEPHSIYLAPNDRRAANENRLPFFERSWPLEESSEIQPSQQPHDLLTDLSRLKFDIIKVDTMRASVEHVLERVPAWLRDVATASDEFRAAAEQLSTNKLAEVRDWPTLPNALMVASIRRWWQTQREGWSARVHGFYNAIGRGLGAPVRYVRHQMQGEQVDPWDQYRKLEWEQGILKAIENTFDKLTFLAEAGHERLRPRVERLLSGAGRQELINHIAEDHRNVDFQAELDDLVARQLARFRQENANSYEFFKRLDNIAAAARPATSMVFILTGFGPVGEVLAPVFANAVASSAAHVVGDAAGGTIFAAVGDKAMSEAAAKGSGTLEAKFRKMHHAFTAERAVWLAANLQKHLLGQLPGELQSAAAIAQSDAYREVRAALDELRLAVAARDE